MPVLEAVAAGVIATTLYESGKRVTSSVADTYDELRSRQRFDDVLSPVATEFHDALQQSVLEVVEDRDLEAPVIRNDWESVIAEIGNLDPVFVDRWSTVLAITRVIADSEGIQLERREALNAELTEAVAEAVDVAFARFREELGEDDELSREFGVTGHIETIRRIEELRRVVEGPEYFEGFPASEVGVEAATAYLTREIETPEYVDRPELEDEPASNRVVVTGRAGTGKTRVLSALLRQADLSDVDRIVVPRESFLSERDLRPLESASFDGDVLLVWDDIHQITADRENELFERAVRRLGDLLRRQGHELGVFSAARSQYVDDLPGTLGHSSGFWGDFHRLELTSLSPEILLELIDAALSSFGIEASDEAKAAFLKKATQTEPSPFYVISVLLPKEEGEELTVEEAEELPESVEEVWEDRLDDLKAKNPDARDVLLSARLLHDLDLRKPVVTVRGIYCHVLGDQPRRRKREFYDHAEDLLRWDWMMLAGEDLRDDDAQFVGHDLQFEILPEGMEGWSSEFAEFVNEKIEKEHLPKDGSFRFSLHGRFGRFLKPLDVSIAESQFRKAAECEEDSPLPHFDLGLLLYNEGRTDEAETQYREALNDNPEYAEAHYNLGVLLKEEGRTDEAETQFREALNDNPDDAEAHFNLALLLEDEERYEDARQHVESSIKLWVEKGKLENAVHDLQLLTSVCDELDDHGSALEHCVQLLTVVEEAGLAGDELYQRVMSILQSTAVDVDEFVIVGHQHAITRFWVDSIDPTLGAFILIWREGHDDPPEDSRAEWLECSVGLLAIEKLTEFDLDHKRQTIRETVADQIDELQPAPRAVFEYVTGSDPNETFDSLTEDIDIAEEEDPAETLSVEDQRTLVFAEILEDLRTAHETPDESDDDA